MNCIRKHIISFAMLLMCATSSAQMNGIKAIRHTSTSIRISPSNRCFVTAYPQVSLLPRDSLRAELDRAISQDKATTTLASNAITGQVLPNTTTTTHAANASECIRMPRRVMKTTAVFGQATSLFTPFQSQHHRLQRMGSWT